MNTWVAVDACTLPTAEQPLRVAEFDRLFAEDLIAVRRDSPKRVELAFRERDGLAAEVEDLTRRETECCSFFQFSLRRATPGLYLDIEVAESRTDVLAGLAERAELLAAGERS